MNLAGILVHAYVEPIDHTIGHVTAVSKGREPPWLHQVAQGAVTPVPTATVNKPRYLSSRGPTENGHQ
jgi:hypothetical protein